LDLLCLRFAGGDRCCLGLVGVVCRLRGVGFMLFFVCVFYLVWIWSFCGYLVVFRAV